MSTHTNTPPPEGWGTNHSGFPTWTMHGFSFGVTPPHLRDHYPHFIARHGSDYTTWTYRPLKAEVPS